ncbi:cadherin-like beta sandwich domain-containing protein [Bacteroidales bacterium OttesenSCG-928-B11]|nr:cadherin-like beta sandwich domain-containing protein [Bacteroidales bacterium OttesenSCG-928-E04]MDL2313223.1 cadherin-like beta sandwich domain-containing protein [Bacteroidales bacterium OttesenSCG-928-B11]
MFRGSQLTKGNEAKELYFCNAATNAFYNTDITPASPAAESIVKVNGVAPPIIDATLSDLTVSEGTLTPAFNPATLDYTVTVANDITQLTIEATANDAGATVVGDGLKDNLIVGSNPFAITVTAEDGTTELVYRVVVTRELYTITASVNGIGGTIEPEGIITLGHGESQTYTFVADDTYQIKSVLIDGINNQQAITAGSYTFDNVTESHTIVVSFELKRYTITASVNGGNGTINPAGSNEYQHGSNATFTMIANQGYFIEEVIVNGIKVGTEDTYTFTNITSNHSITVKFAQEVGIEDFKEIEIKVYPNPATEYVIIKSEKEINKVVIFNSAGKKVFENKNVKGEKLKISVNHFPTGMYYIDIDGSTEKMIKM